ncbi:hypothetical protein BJF78_32570 [Pseudonocardia sp. CNS-139]|nr:hypothetical protein BJF78_32570 [Pseudonocardia sp. CNS-139]
MQLRRHSAVPLYRQMEAALLERIDSGDLRPGERLPTETELAAQWKVNRLTVRQAIGELARAGRVVVRAGPARSSRSRPWWSRSTCRRCPPRRPRPAAPS